jgi:hypothetical protein
LKLNFETQFLLCKRYAATIYKISSQLFPKFERKDYHEWENKIKLKSSSEILI